jgi:hypothetical protein
MRNRYLLLALLGLVALLIVPAPAEEKVDAGKIDGLIEKLGSPAFTDREKATQALDAIGEPALEALRKAAKSSDAEIRKRATTLVDRIEQRTETARQLAPTMVHLKYRNVALQEALADFRKQSGYNIVLQDPEGKLKDSRITLDTGKVSFWNALEQFCAKAGLVEADPSRGLVPVAPRLGLPVRPAPGAAPVPPAAAPAPVPIEKVPPKPAKNGGPGLNAEAPAVAPVPGRVVEVKVEVKPGAAPAVPPAPAALPAVPVLPAAVPLAPLPAAAAVVTPAVARLTNPSQITLVPGKAPHGPADTSSAIRIQALPDNKTYGPSTDKEIVLPLRVTPEPKLFLQRILEVRISKARDDNGQDLEVSEGPRADAPVSSVVLPGGGFVQPARTWTSGHLGHHFLPVRLKKGAKPSKVLEELSGTVGAEILTAVQPFIEVPDVLKAAGKEFKGKAGGLLEIVDVEKNAAGQTIIRYELEIPPGVTPDTTPGNAVPPALNRPAIRPLAPARGPGRGVAPGAAPVAPGAAPVAPAADKKAEEKKEAEKGAAGKIEKPAAVGAGGGGIVIAIAVPAGGVVQPAFVGNTTGVTLRDDKGNILPTTLQVTGGKVNAGKLVVTHAMTYTPQKDHGAPTKLVFSGRKNVAITIPFTIKNITLPPAK